MIKAVNTGLSALQAFQKLVDVTANNIANAATDGFKKNQVRIQETAPSGVEVTLSRDEAPGPFLSDDSMTLPRESSNVSLEEEMVTLIVAQRLYEVNLKALKAAADMEKSLVDLLQ